MKTRTAVAIFILFAGFIWIFHKFIRKPPQVVSTYRQEKVTVEPGTEAELMAKLKEIISQQKTIELPHMLSTGEKVIRISPDGIHTRTASSVIKLLYDEMDDALLEKYFIDTEVAALYQKKMQERARKARELSSQRYAARRAREAKIAEKLESARKAKKEQE